MDTQAIRAQMPTLVRGHVPSNVRSFKFNIFDGQPKVSTLGFHIDPKPFEGKVIATTDPVDLRQILRNRGDNTEEDQAIAPGAFKQIFIETFLPEEHRGGQTSNLDAGAVSISTPPGATAPRMSWNSGRHR